MQKKLEQARELFLTGVDDEDYQDNLSYINDLEKSISENESFSEWQDHDITKRIARDVKKIYVDTSMSLLEDRRLDQAAREKLWAKQDAMLLMLSLMSKDTESELKSIDQEITRIINATN